MHLKFNLKYVFYTSLILFMLPCFCFIIGKQFVSVYMPVSVIFFAILSIFFNKEFTHKLLYYYNQTSFKYFILFVLWSFITIFISIVRGNFFIKGFLTSTVGGLSCSIIIPCILVIFMVPKYISTNKIIKLLYLFFWMLLLLGVLDFIFFYLNIPILKDILLMINNKRILLYSLGDNARVFLGDYPRACSVFEEPSYLGYFILVTSPIIYEWTFSKYKMYQNTFFNNLVKKTIIPLMWIALILTQSPIFLIFNIFFTSFYFLFLKRIFYKLLKNIYFYLVLALIILLFFILFLKFDLTNTYLNRIILVLTHIKSFQDFINVEPSLGTRIIVIVNAIKMGVNNILFGVGYGNMSHMISHQLQQSPLPLTVELKNLIIFNKTSPPSTIFIKIFSETGILGTILFYYFIIKEINILDKLILFLNEKDRIILNGLKLFLIVYIFSTFYSSIINDSYTWIIISLTIVLTNFHIQRIKNERI